MGTTKRSWVLAIALATAGCGGDDGGATADSATGGDDPAQGGGDGADSASSGDAETTGGEAGGSGSGSVAVGDGGSAGGVGAGDFVASEGLTSLLMTLFEESYVMVGVQAVVSLEKSYYFGFGVDEDFDPPVPTASCSVIPTLQVGAAPGSTWTVQAEFDEDLSSPGGDSFSLWSPEPFGTAPGSQSLQWGLYDSAEDAEWSLVPGGLSFFGCARVGEAEEVIRCETTWVGEASGVRREGGNITRTKTGGRVDLVCFFAALESDLSECLQDGCDDQNPCTVETCTVDGCESFPLGTEGTTYAAGDEVPEGVLDYACEDGDTAGYCKNGTCEEGPCDGECPLAFSFDDETGSCSVSGCNTDGAEPACSEDRWARCPWRSE